MNIRIDKRIPFGFKGIWGKCYKHTNYNETKSSITYQRSSYYDIGFDVQFKYLEDGIDKEVFNTQSISNLIEEGKYRVIKSTDATFNGESYESVIQVSDIVLLDGKFWVVDKVQEKSIYNPATQTTYYIGLKTLLEKVLTGEN